MSGDMLRVSVTVDGQDEPIVTGISSRDIYRWEKTGRGRSLAHLRAQLHMSYVYELSHTALQRRNLWSGSLEHLVDTADIEVLGSGALADSSDTDEDDDETEDPTNAGA